MVLCDRMIEAFRECTVPIGLDTSYNVDEPVACRLREAINRFLRTDVDVLVLREIAIARR